MHFNHTNSKVIREALLRNETSQLILLTRGDQVRFGLRVRLVPYPETALAVWVMLAVRYKPLI